jgi:signal transduction histidine kinase
VTGPIGPVVVPGPGRTAAGPDARSGIPSNRRPWTDSRFWLLQLVVLAVSLVRLAVTVAFHLDPSDLVLVVSTVAVFVVPVVVASLTCGLPGGLATVAWVCVLSVPRLADATSRDRAGALGAEVLQLAVLGAIAGLIGQRMSAQTRYRDQADIARKARLRAELLYQDMFESNRSPILIVDADGCVVESNGSADHAFGPAPGTPGPPIVSTGLAPPRRLVDVVGARAAALVLTLLVSHGEDGDGTGAPPDGAGIGSEPTDHDERIPPVAFEVDGRPVLLRPTATLVGSTGSDRRMQVIFEDVTVETQRHDRMEAYAGNVVLGQEEERRHIAQELHDGPLQTLIHLCRQIDLLHDSPGPEGSGATSLASMRATVEETVDELRSIARGLRPSVLDDLGLVASINQVLTEATARRGVAGRLDVEGTVGRLAPAVELALFRIAQESITNVEHHARADRVTVTLEFAPDGIRLRVQDDGVGFDRGRHRDGVDGRSLGLPGMNERARLIGGRLEVTSQVGKGTTVTAWVPDGRPRTI